jgi:hypothetical protein
MIVHLGPPNRKNSTGSRFPAYGTAVAFAANALVRTGSGVLNKIYATNKNAATAYMWVFDGTTSAGNLLLPPIPIATNASVAVDDRYGIPFKTGLFIAFSSTVGTFTVVATTDFAVEVGYSVDNTSPTTDP